MNHSENTQKANDFECSVGYMLLWICNKNKDYVLRVDKNIRLKIDPVVKNLRRKSDGKKSKPDFEIIYKRKSVIIDAKNYDKVKINWTEIEKSVNDAKVRSTKYVIIVMQENSVLSNGAYNYSLLKNVILIKLFKGGSLIENTEDLKCKRSYLSIENMQVLEQAVDKVFMKPPMILFTQEGMVDQRSKAVKRKESLKDYGFVGNSDGTVNESCEAWRLYLNYSNKTSASNYNHRQAIIMHKAIKSSNQIAKTQADQIAKSQADHNAKSKTDKIAKLSANQTIKKPEKLNQNSSPSRPTKESVSESRLSFVFSCFMAIYDCLMSMQSPSD